jgi:endonuclease/exonuclease/phosphatase family metal-dependent hydrolase
VVRVLLDLALWCAALAVAGIVAVRLLGLDEWRHTVAVLALTPYALGVALVLVLVTLIARRAVLGVVATVLAVTLAVPVLPRLLPDGQPTAAGHPLVVASINLHVGNGTGGIVDLVRSRRVDVLSLQELTPAAVEALDAAGLREELPYRVYYTAPAVLGSGIASRYPLQQRVLLPPTTARQPAVHVSLPDGAEAEVQLVHPVQPLGQHGNEKWRAELAQLPRPRTDGVARLLVGDFNSTLDHPALRRILATGYVDAADQVGAGLRTTWPTDRGLWPPPVAIDHVLADARCSVRSFDVVDIPHTDHRAVVAELTLP